MTLLLGNNLKGFVYWLCYSSWSLNPLINIAAVLSKPHSNSVARLPEDCCTYLLLSLLFPQDLICKRGYFMDARSSKLRVDVYYLSSLVSFLLSSVSVAVSVGVQACKCPAMKSWRCLKGTKFSVFSLFFRKLLMS